MKKRPIVLCIMDGYGISESINGNAVRLANTPNLDDLMAMYPNTTISASGMPVGLPDGQMGNSEVGHLNIGAGRTVYQSLTLINKALNEKTFFENEKFLKAIQHAKDNGSKLHIWGLLSNGGVHSSNEHIFGLLELAKQQGLDKVYVHAFLDGRDVAPDSGVDFVKELQEKIVISIAANFPFAKYEQILLPNTHHLSTIPNTPVAIGEGIFICENTHSLSDEELDLFTKLFSTISIVQFVETKQLSIGGTVAGCGPAFASMFIEALADAGVMHGLARPVAYKLASQMIVGTGKLQLATNNHPGAMKDAVCSPAGTTIVGVATLERKGFRSAVIDAIDAIENK